MRFGGWVARRALDRDCQSFDQVQSELLLSILEKHRDTLLGRDLGFTGLRSADDFRAHVPLTRYPFYVEGGYIERIQRGEKNIMTAEDVTLLGATSGTSGKTSLLPHTREISTAFFFRGICLVFNSMFSGAFPDIDQLQRTCKLTFQPRWKQSEGGVKIGPASSSPDDKGFDRLLPLYSSPLAAYREPNEAAAMYLHALFALRDRKLGIVEANFAPLVDTFCSCLLNNKEALLKDIANGTALGAQTLGASPDTLLQLAPLLTANASRARELSEAFVSDTAHETGESGMHTMPLLRKLWPDLHVILTVTTGAFEPYAQRLRHAYIGTDTEKGAVPIYSPLYAATEGLLGVNISPKETSPQYVLPPRGLYYEFLPLQMPSLPLGHASPDRTSNPDQHTSDTRLQTPATQDAESSPLLDKADPAADATSTLTARQVHVGREYELVITNLAGLVRYRLGDVVRIAGMRGGGGGGESLRMCLSTCVRETSEERGKLTECEQPCVCVSSYVFPKTGVSQTISLSVFTGEPSNGLCRCVCLCMCV